MAATSGEGNPHTFIRPFRYFIRFLDKMKEELAKIQNKVSPGPESDASIAAEAAPSEQRLETAEQASRAPSPEPDEKQTEAPEEDGNAQPDEKVDDAEEKKKAVEKEIEALYSSVEAMQEVECYIKFVQENIMPFYHLFDPTNETLPQKVRYIDVWNVIRPGDILYVPNETLSKRRPER